MTAPRQRGCCRHEHTFSDQSRLRTTSRFQPSRPVRCFACALDKAATLLEQAGDDFRRCTAVRHRKAGLLFRKAVVAGIRDIVRNLTCDSNIDVAIPDLIVAEHMEASSAFCEINFAQKACQGRLSLEKSNKLALRNAAKGRSAASRETKSAEARSRPCPGRGASSFRQFFPKPRRALVNWSPVLATL